MRRAGQASRVWLAAVTVIGFVAAVAAPGAAHPDHPGHEHPLPAHASESMRAFADDHQHAADLQAVSGAACDNGSAAGYPCSNVDLLAFMPLADIGGTRSNSAANDIWGWTDPSTGKEYAIVGRVYGTSFVDISDPTAPVYLGELPTHGAFGSTWRDIKVYADHAFIVSEARGHGMQVFDLTQLRSVSSPPVTFAETAHYAGNATAHNIAVNEDTGYAYIVGAGGKSSCSGGLHMVDIRTPTAPAFAGCFAADGYTHDTQCVLYAGPDMAHQNREICFNSNEDTVTIVDVSDKANPTMLSRTGYAGAGYTHQGWLTEDHRYFLVDDEMDERNLGHGTRTRVFDVSDLDSPAITGWFDSTSPAIDHNQYVKGGFTYQANYRAGLRILQLGDLTSAQLSEVAHFDVYPSDDNPDFNGAWSTYPYFASGVVVVSGIEQGLFVLQPHLPTPSGPSVSITDPTNGATVSREVVIRATTSTDVAAVEFSVGSRSLGSGTKTEQGDWAITWQTTNDDDGTYTVTAVATTGSATASDSISVIVANTTTTTDPPVHVGDLDGVGTHSRGGRWDATVTITVHDANHDPVGGASVSGTWSGGATGSASCTTDASGQCSVTVTGIHRNSTSVTFTVDGIVATGYGYSAENHDPDGDSDGTTITMNKP